MITGGGGRSQKKDLNSELNLTPFIDLLSTCICFLLISAVWVEIGNVEIKQSHGTYTGTPAKKDTFDLDLVFKNQTALQFNLKKSGKTVKTIEIKSTSPQGLLTQLQETITSQIFKIKGKDGIGEKAIDIANATIAPQPMVNYGQLVSTLDILRKNQIVNIGILAAEGQRR